MNGLAFRVDVLLSNESMNSKNSTKKTNFPNRLKYAELKKFLHKNRCI